MKKILAIMLVLVLSLSLFAACGDSDTGTTNETPSETGNEAEPDTGGETEPEETGGEASGEEVTLVWAAWDVSTDNSYQALADAYMEKNPNVNIEFLEIAAADFMTDLSTQLAGGTEIDVMGIKDIPGYNNLVKQGHLLGLSDYISSAGIDTSVYNGLVEQITVGGEVYGLPYRSDVWVIFYNKDLFDAAGVDYPTNDMTIAEYDALMREMTSGSGSEKVYGGHYHTWRSTVQLWGILDGQNTIVDGNYDFLADTYNNILAQQNDGIVMDYAELSTSSTHYSGVFYNEQAAMLNMGSWFISSLFQAPGNGEMREDLNWGMVKYPHPEGVEAGTTLGTVTSVAVNSKIDDAKKDAALDLAKFISSEEGALVLAGFGQTPAILSGSVIDILSSNEYFPDDDASKEALNSTQVYLEFPLHDNASDIETVLNEEHAEIMMGNKTVDDAIASMNERVGEILG